VSADPAQVLRVVPAGGDDVERRYAADDWRAGELGVPAARGRTAVSFTGIGQSWLREAAKRWARQRLSIGCAFNTICAGAVALKRFSRFLAAGEPPTARPEDIDRALLERYLGYLAQLPLAESTKVLSRCSSAGCWRKTVATGGYRRSRSGRRSTRRNCPAGAGRCPGSSRSS